MTVSLSDLASLPFSVSTEELENEFRQVSARLEMIGLSPYEARAYIALVAHGYGETEAIAATAKIPRTSAYKVLRSLEEKNFAISTTGRPRIYKPESPKKIADRVVDEIRDTFQKLELLNEVVAEKGEPQLVYTVAGKERVIEKISELLDIATRSFIISTPAFSQLYSRGERKLHDCINRGIEVTIITKPLQRVPEGCTVVRNDRLLATDVITDGERALIASPDLATCGYTDNAQLAAHLERFLEILVEKG